MATDGLPVEKLRAYLRELKPETQAMLLAGIERAQLRGEDVPGCDLILNELREVMGNATATVYRVGNASRLFFKPLEPFLVEYTPEQKHRGRIARTSLEPIWGWICRDLLAAPAAAYCERVTAALVADDTAAAEKLARDFQEEARKHIQNTLAAVHTDDKARRKLIAQVGTQQPLDELRDIVAVFKSRDALALIGSRLPQTIRNLADEQLDNVKAVLDSPSARPPDVFPYAVVLVMNRLALSWQVIRLAVKAAATDDAARVAETPYAITFTLVLGDLVRLVTDLRARLKSGRTTGTAALLKEIHDSVRGLRTEMDLSGDTPWSRQLAAIRADVSDAVKAEIETVSGRVRRLLRPRAAKEIPPNSALDQGDVADAEAAVEFLNACRTYASELAVNEVTLRVHSELSHYLDTGTPTLLEALRATGGPDRKFRLSQVDAAVRFCSRIFGASYAAALAKAAEVAAKGEQKLAKA